MTAKRGYLCRLSGRKILSKSDWKRKFFLLYDDKLYYYDTEGGCGGEAGIVESCYLMQLVLFWFLPHNLSLIKAVEL